MRVAFALQLRKKHGKPSVRVRKTSVRVQCSTQLYNTNQRNASFTLAFALQLRKTTEDP